MMCDKEDKNDNNYNDHDGNNNDSKFEYYESDKHLRYIFTRAIE